MSFKISVYASRMPLPIQFTLHTWVVTEHNGEKDRFDVFGFKKDGEWERAGHLYKNYHNPSYGCPMLALGSKPFFHDDLQWKVNSLFTVTGSERSTAEGLFRILHSDVEQFPHLHTYHLLPGPNSNTFTQWALDYIEPGRYTLPSEAVGRGYGRKFLVK